MQHNVDADGIKGKDDQAVFRLLHDTGVYQGMPVTMHPLDVAIDASITWQARPRALRRRNPGHRRLPSDVLRLAIRAIDLFEDLTGRSSQNWARFPKYRPSLTAVSAVIDRRPLSMSVMRPDGTLRSSASRFALSSRTFSSRFKKLPGCVAYGMRYPLW